MAERRGRDRVGGIAVVEGAAAVPAHHHRIILLAHLGQVSRRRLCSCSAQLGLRLRHAGTHRSGDLRRLLRSRGAAHRDAVRRHHLGPRRGPAARGRHPHVQLRLGNWGPHPLRRFGWSLAAAGRRCNGQLGRPRFRRLRDRRRHMRLAILGLRMLNAGSAASHGECARARKWRQTGGPAIGGRSDVAGGQSHDGQGSHSEGGPRVELRSHSPGAYLGHRGSDPPQADWRGDVRTGRQWWNLGCHGPGGDAGHAGPLSPDASTIGAAARPRQRPATLAGLAGEHAEWVTGTATAGRLCLR
eukprot:scaffold6211_cov118-Isochrysis_galbana.AAC.1